MSRSIHTTWSQLSKEYKKHKSKKSAQNDQELQKMHQQLCKKRQLKKQIVHQRKDESVYLSTDPDVLPIIVHDESEFLHYAITEKDIRAFLNKLPKGIIDGLVSIELKAGYGKHKNYDELPDPDPYTGRPGYEFLPGVYYPKVLGTYFSSQNKIEIYAYAYKGITELSMWNVCLKIYMLMTLAHELSHHYDFQYRMGRGRWLRDNKDKIEAYAENMEYKWLGEIIIPYIEDTYKAEVDALHLWILNKVGIKLPLSILAGDPRKTCKNGFMKLFFATDEYFYDFVREIYEGKDLAEARIGLATGFHYADMYELSLEIIDTVLKDHPKCIKVLTLKADTFVHQEKYKEAEQIARGVLAIDSNEFEAWYILCDVFYNQSDWVELLRVSKKAIDLASKERNMDRIALYQVKAMIETGELHKAEEKLRELSGSKKKFVIKRITELSEEITTQKKQVNNK